MGALRYAVPFGFLALLPPGWALGGGWLLAPVIATPLVLATLDALLGEAVAGEDAQASLAHRLIPWLYLPLQLAAIGWAGLLAARPGASAAEIAGLALGCGFTAGVFGFVAAHEMIHSPARAERALGCAFLAGVLYLHFRIAHLHGHHRRAATREDPATARLGESLYAFLLRSVGGQYVEAWRFEAERLRRAGRLALSLRNRMVGYLLAEAALLVAVGLASLNALAFLLATAIIAVLLLEGFNYIAHYGLSRRALPGGRREPLGPQHSWNSARRMNNWSLMNMGRHSDHHRRSGHPYAGLEPLPGGAELPCGYAGAILLSLAPPLWRRVMDRRVAAVMAQPLPTPRRLAA